MQAPQAPQIPNPFSGLPRLTKGLAIFLAVMYLLSWNPFCYKVLILFPMNVLYNYFLWSIFTAGYFSDNLLGALFSVIFVLFAGKFLEPVWGSKEFLKFVILINAMTYLLIFDAIWALYAIFPGTFLITLTVPFCGFTAVMSALLVAFKQMVPNQEIALFFIIRFRARLIPLVFLVVIVLFAVLSGFYRDCVLASLGTYLGWIYLRFFQPKSDGSRGDRDSEFTFASFFPDFLGVVINPIANAFYFVLVKWWRDRGSSSSISTSASRSYQPVATMAPQAPRPAAPSAPPPPPPAFTGYGTSTPATPIVPAAEAPSPDREAQRRAALEAAERRLASTAGQTKT